VVVSVDHPPTLLHAPLAFDAEFRCRVSLPFVAVVGVGPPTCT